MSYLPEVRSIRVTARKSVTANHGTPLDRTLAGDTEKFNMFVAPIVQCPGCRRPCAQKDHLTGRGLCYCEPPKRPSAKKPKSTAPAKSPRKTRAVQTTVLSVEERARRYEDMILNHLIKLETMPVSLIGGYLTNLPALIRVEVMSHL